MEAEPADFLQGLPSKFKVEPETSGFVLYLLGLSVAGLLTILIG